tara:strand:+ start:242 stop:574 length:333 start_codon:yes stop_codon:yes gene_type:complete
MSVPIDEAWAVLKQEAQPPTPMQPPGQQPTAYEQAWGRPEPQWMKDLREKQAMSAFRSAQPAQPVQPAAEKKVGVMGKIKGGLSRGLRGLASMHPDKDALLEHYWGEGGE